ncbi:putative N-ethylmaleimide reductase [Dactylonectria estremocensis]|uniref:N-ethylmaleimide reductase n=1 Tax=Dactylonectria estremocensis TaxID=1079267 RepID=A0A9P9IUN8_9HYPO|nr:putative N-ethylmaleimide reductase [Dactylonectria estremocensis]
MAQSRLLTPLSVGSIQLKHRVGLCPLTRFRATDGHVPSDLMVEYYSQRGSVSGTLLVAEGTFISVEDGGYANVPGIYNQEQIEAWKKVTDAVHKNGSYMFCQLWALGRAADPEVTAAEGTTIASSDALAIDAKSPQPRRLTVDEVKLRIQNYVSAAKNAIAAGFDGVELHGANGYLIDQFLQDCCNQRDDEYGGSIENRSRFALEVVKAVSEAIGAEKTAIRFSPWSTYNGMRMANPISQFSDIIGKLAKLNLAYLHLVESRIAGNADVEADDKLTFAYNLWEGPILVAGGLKPDVARQLVDEEHPQKNIVAMFGRSFISTPDLPFRIAKGLDLNPYIRDTFYTAKSPVGYIDYPFSKEYLAEKVAQRG